MLTSERLFLRVAYGAARRDLKREEARAGEGAYPLASSSMRLSDPSRSLSWRGRQIRKAHAGLALLPQTVSRRLYGEPPNSLQPLRGLCRKPEIVVNGPAAC